MSYWGREIPVNIKNMNYELIKQLRDAKFIFKEHDFTPPPNKSIKVRCSNCIEDNTTMNFNHCVHTLSELIEAVQNIKLIYTGEENTGLFFLWMDLGKIWTASIGVTPYEELGFDKKTMFPVWKYSSQGDTPEIAVANLWIKLHENKF